MSEKSKQNGILIFPEFQTLKDELNRMRTELSMLLLEKDELQFVVARNIHTQYMLALGSLEYQAYEAQCAVLRLRRKIELVQAAKNRQEIVDLAEIEKTLDKEFEEYQQKLDAQIESMNEAIRRSHAPKLTPEETKEFKKMYREIVKHLHPDMNPHVSDAQIRLFEHAVQAYKNGDLSTLKTIYEMVAAQQLPDAPEPDALSMLREQHKKTVQLIRTVQQDIAEMKKEYPFTVEELLNDPNRLSAKKAELENTKNSYHKMQKFYAARLEQLLEE